MKKQQRQAQEQQVVAALVCLECGTEAGLARGWRAYLDAEASLLVYCPHCAAREFDA
jgi:DNA-directed RNA polymerase subunit RPC12/RpoP